MTAGPGPGLLTQLYNLDAVGYESVMLGMYSVFMGPPNFVAEKTGLPKINDLKRIQPGWLPFFSWLLQQFPVILPPERQLGLRLPAPANGICTVAGDKLHFYYSLFRVHHRIFGSHKYSGGAVGVATLRQDGFAAMVTENGSGTLLTEKRPMQAIISLLTRIAARVSCGRNCWMQKDIRCRAIPVRNAAPCAARTAPAGNCTGMLRASRLLAAGDESPVWLAKCQAVRLLDHRQRRGQEPWLPCGRFPQKPMPGAKTNNPKYKAVCGYAYRFLL